MTSKQGPSPKSKIFTSSDATHRADSESRGRSLLPSVPGTHFGLRKKFEKSQNSKSTSPASKSLQEHRIDHDSSSEAPSSPTSSNLTPLPTKGISTLFKSFNTPSTASKSQSERRISSLASSTTLGAFIRRTLVPPSPPSKSQDFEEDHFFPPSDDEEIRRTLSDIEDPKHTQRRSKSPPPKSKFQSSKKVIQSDEEEQDTPSKKKTASDDEDKEESEEPPRRSRTLPSPKERASKYDKHGRYLDAIAQLNADDVALDDEEDQAPRSALQQEKETFHLARAQAYCDSFMKIHQTLTKEDAQADPLRSNPNPSPVPQQQQQRGESLRSQAILASKHSQDSIENKWEEHIR